MPVATSLVAGAGRVLSEDPKVSQQLAKMAEDSPSMKAAAEAYARRVEVKQAILLKVYRPLARWLGASKSYFEHQFAEDMLSRVAEIPAENMRTPRPSVAVPAMIGLGYSYDEPDLRDMYLNLLATASDDRRDEDAHPSFPEIIRQLSGSEARTLLPVLTSNILPIVVLHRTAPGVEGYQIIRNNVVNLVDLAPELAGNDDLASMWVDNWVRLGLVIVDYTRYLTRPSAYDWVDGSPVVRLLRDEGTPVNFDRGSLRATDFGLRFAAAVGGSEESNAAAAPPD